MKVKKKLSCKSKSLKATDLKIGVCYVCTAPVFYEDQIVIRGNGQVIFIEYNCYLGDDMPCAEKYSFRELHPGESFEVTND